MATLNGFPLVNQRTTVTGDGRPSENALFDCVAACIDAMCRYWLHTPENSVFNPDRFKDAAYGENWRNDGTDAARYVDFCKTLGISLHMVSADSPGHAVALAHQYIDKGIPCMFTEDDPYVDTRLPQYAGWTHACCFFEDDANGLTALDPFIGKALYKTNGAWASVLRSNQLWIAERIDHMGGVPSGWRPAGNVLYSPSHMQGGPEIAVTGPFRDYVLANGWRPSDRFIEVGHHVNTMQYADGTLGGGFIQTSLWSMLLMPDAGPQAGKVIYAWLGVESAWLRKAYEAQLAEIATLKQEIAAHQPGLDAAQVHERLAALGKIFQEGGDLAAQPIQ